MRYRVTLTVTIITGSLLIVFGIINVLTEKYYAGFPEIILGFFALVANTYILVIKKNYTAPALAINALIVFLSIYLYWDGGLYNTGVYWCIAFPGLFISTRGVKKGTIWVAFQISALMILFILSRLSIITVAYNVFESLAFLLVYGFSFYILYSYEQSRAVYQREIRRLNEMLPICSFCKRIRDKNGKWHSLESYLNREADIDFSHGICPECGKKHYPDFLGSDKD